MFKLFLLPGTLPRGSAGVEVSVEVLGDRVSSPRNKEVCRFHPEKAAEGSVRARQEDL